MTIDQLRVLEYLDTHGPTPYAEVLQHVSELSGHWRYAGHAIARCHGRDWTTGGCDVLELTHVGHVALDLQRLIDWTGVTGAALLLGVTLDEVRCHA